MIHTIIILLVFLVAFMLGRWQGRIEGIKLGAAKAIIDFRIATLERGYCPICHYSIEQCENHKISV